MDESLWRNSRSAGPPPFLRRRHDPHPAQLARGSSYTNSSGYQKPTFEFSNPQHQNSWPDAPLANTRCEKWWRSSSQVKLSRKLLNCLAWFDSLSKPEELDSHFLSGTIFALLAHFDPIKSASDLLESSLVECPRIRVVLACP